MFDVLLDLVDDIIEGGEEYELSEILKTYIDIEREESNGIIDVLDRVNRL